MLYTVSSQPGTGALRTAAAPVGPADLNCDQNASLTAITGVRQLARPWPEGSGWRAVGKGGTDASGR